MRVPILFSLMLGMMVPALAQPGPFERPVRCATPASELDLRKRLPHRESREEFERWMQIQLREKVQERSLEVEGILSLPVVVHIIHNGEPVGSGSNISQLQIQSQIEVLNEDYRRAFGTLGYNSDPLGADIQLEFCLAQADPDGNTMKEPGIHRVNRSLAGFNAPPFSRGYVENFIQPATYWDPDKYLNIWVCDTRANNGQALLGFAQYPSMSTLDGIPTNPGGEENDGVVIHYNAFGRVGNLEEPYTLGRTTTHEIGHWLGLIHVWGDSDNCQVDDYCDDTPPSDGPVYDCPDNLLICGKRSMVENFMQYTDDACMNIFTQDQRDRMRVVMAASPRRLNLLNSNVCNSPEAIPVARFEADKQEGCPGMKVQFLDQSRNSPQSWEWNFEGGEPSSSDKPNPLVRYKFPGSYAVSLRTTNENGTSTELQNAYIDVRADLRDVFYQQDFESGASDWLVLNPDNEFSWEIASVVASKKGQKSFFVNCYEYSKEGERDRLISPLLNFENRTEVFLSFDHAYRPFSNSSRDSLLVFVSLDGGISYPYKVFATAENGSRNFATSGVSEDNFVPSNAFDWCSAGDGFASCNEVDLSQFAGESRVRIAFEVYNDFGNNIYLDNVSLSSSCGGITPRRPSLEGEGVEISIFPNPATDQLSIEFQLKEGLNDLVIEMMDLTGRIVYKEKIGRAINLVKKDISLTTIPSGTYLLRVSGGNIYLFDYVLVL